MRHKNKDWNNGSNTDINQEQATRAVMMDIRDELQAIRRLIECPNVQAGFIAMRQLEKRMTKRFPLKRKK